MLCALFLTLDFGLPWRDSGPMNDRGIRMEASAETVRYDERGAMRLGILPFATSLATQTMIFAIR
jgi:hypothetical protein